jgi:hypothetical protein
MLGHRPRLPASGPRISHARGGLLMRLLSPVIIQVPLRLLCRQAAQHPDLQAAANIGSLRDRFILPFIFPSPFPPCSLGRTTQAALEYIAAPIRWTRLRRRWTRTTSTVSRSA